MTGPYILKRRIARYFPRLDIPPAFREGLDPSFELWETTNGYVLCLDMRRGMFKVMERPDNARYYAH